MFDAVMLVLLMFSALLGLMFVALAIALAVTDPEVTTEDIVYGVKDKLKRVRAVPTKETL